MTDYFETHAYEEAKQAKEMAVNATNKIEQIEAIHEINNNNLTDKMSLMADTVKKIEENREAHEEKMEKDIKGLREYVNTRALATSGAIIIVLLAALGGLYMLNEKSQQEMLDHLIERLDK